MADSLSPFPFFGRKRAAALQEEVRRLEEQNHALERRERERAQSEAELKRRLAETTFSAGRLSDLLRALGRLEPGTVRGAILQAVALLAGAESCSWWDLEQDGQQLRLVQTRGWAMPSERVSVAADQGLMGLALSQRRAAAFTELPEDVPLMPVPGLTSFRTLICAPVILEGACEAVLTVEALPFERFSASTLRTLAQIGELAGVVLAQSAAYQSAQAERVQDPKTRLLQPNYLIRRINEESRRAERYDFPFSLVLACWTGPAEFNGDASHAVLVRAAAVLRSGTRATDLAGLGKEPGKLLVALPFAPLDGALATAFRLKPVLEEALAKAESGGRWRLAVACRRKGESGEEVLDRLQGALERLDPVRPDVSVAVAQ